MKNYLLFVFTVVMMLLLGEYLLRLAFPYKLRTINFQGEIAYNWNENYLVGLRPNMQKVFYRTKWNGGIKINWQTNKDGFRGPELAIQPKYRVVVYGDSNIQARFSKLEDTYPEQLRQQLAMKGVESEVVNAGIIGLGPDQLLLKCLDETPFLQPDLIIVNIFCDNDFGDLLRNHLFDLDEQGKLKGANIAPKKDAFLKWLKNERSKSQCLLCEESVALVNRIFGEKENPFKKQQYIEMLQTRCFADYSEFVKMGKNEITHFEDYYDLDLALYPEGEPAKVKRKLMGAVLDSMYDFASKQNIKMVFQLLPSAIDITHNYIIAKEDLAALSADYHPENLTSEVTRICAEKNIPFVNLYPLFEKEAADDLYFLQDGHWNDKGQALAAKAMVTMLLQQGLVSLNQ